MRTAFITGANKGLGLAAARGLGEQGVRVIIGARDPRKSDVAVRELVQAGIDAEPVLVDVTDPASVRGAAEEVARRHGHIDILINNAGILPEATAEEVDGPLDPRMFETTFATNVLGAVEVTHAFLPLLQKAKAGRIVNVSSTIGSLADQSNPTRRTTASSYPPTRPRRRR